VDFDPYGRFDRCKIQKAKSGRRIASQPAYNPR
jgi:hypothetical protein